MLLTVATIIALFLARPFTGLLIIPIILLSLAVMLSPLLFIMLIVSKLKVPRWPVNAQRIKDWISGITILLNKKTNTLNITKGAHL